MDDLQLNIVSTTKKNIKKAGPPQKNVEGYKFASKPNFGGKIMARKRPQTAGQIKFKDKNTEEPQKKVPKLANVQPKQTDDLASNLRDLSENKGKFQGKDYQQLSDDLQIKQKPRSGAWISSLFKNNPEVPRIGQRAVKPVVEKVFSGNTFADLTIHPHSVANLKQNLNLTELMTVQKKAIPVILQGRDVLIRSQTGSGKTLAYALPVVEALQAIRPKVNRNDGIRVVVVVPTRELAVQTYELFVKLTKPFIWIVPGLLSGGQKRKAEKARLRKGLSILVGTPGRINDHLRHTHSLNFAKTGCLILDEADRLLDMGYEKDVAAIVKSIEDHKRNATYDPIALVRQTNSKKIINTEELSSPKKNDDETPDKHPLTDVFLSTERQTILLSATLTKAVENLAGITMKNPVFVDTAEGKSVVADSLKHSEVAKKVVQNVIKTDKEEGSDAKEEKMRDMKDSDESDSKCNDNKTVPENDNTPSRRGLKAFNGFLYRELFIDEKDNASTIDKQHLNQSSKPTVSKQTANKDDSDSDSDYEYFKVQKELEAKNINKKDGEDDDEETLVSSPPKIDNTFVEALKTAVKEDELVLPATVNQTFIIVPMKLRLVTLCSQIIEHCVLNKKGGKMIVFMATLEMVDYLSDLIETVLTGKKDKKKEGLKSKKKKAKNDEDDSDSAAESESDYEMDYQGQSEGNLVPVDIDVFSLHGSMPHERRMEVFKQFRQAKRGLLICTDVAARGLDVPRVDLVLQYCAPASITDYVHRVGRTGRAAQVGAAVMFLLPSEAEFVRHLEQKRIRLRQGDESRALEALRTVAAGAASVQRAAICLQARLELLAHSSRDWLARASRAYTSWVRFYSGYPREVRAWLDARQLHLGHAAKAFALRDTPGALAKRSRSDPHLNREKPANRLTVREEEQKKRPGFPKVKIGAFGGRVMNKQSSMHTASEFDNGLPPVDTYNRNNNKKKRK